MANDPQPPSRAEERAHRPAGRRSGLLVLTGIVGSIVAIVLLAIWAAHHG